jgi:hypothetical protein
MIKQKTEHLIAIEEHIKYRRLELGRAILSQSGFDKVRGLAIAAHIAEMAELKYQLAMTPERVIFAQVQ